MQDDQLRDLLLATVEASLEAQLRAVRRLRNQPLVEEQESPRSSLSQVEMAFEVLKKARAPLHISEILNRIQAQFGISVDSESLVSSLSKRVMRRDRFLRTEKNTFTVRPEAR